MSSVVDPATAWDVLASALGADAPEVGPGVRVVHIGILSYLCRLAEILVRGGMSVRVRGLAGRTVGARGPAIAALRRAVLIAEKYPSQLRNDARLVRLIGELMGQPESCKVLACELRAEILEGVRPPRVASANGPPKRPLAVLMSAASLAEALGVPTRRNAVEVELRKCAKTRPDCRTGIEAPRKGEPRYQYRVGMVWDHLLACLPRWLTD
jgi:hypothetical protein